MTENLKHQTKKLNLKQIPNNNQEGESTRLHRKDHLSTRINLSGFVIKQN